MRQLPFFDIHLEHWTLFQWSNGCYLSRVRKRKSRLCHTQVSLPVQQRLYSQVSQVERAAVLTHQRSSQSETIHLTISHKLHTSRLWAISINTRPHARTLTMRFERDFHHTCKEEERTCESGFLLSILCLEAAADLYNLVDTVCTNLLILLVLKVLFDPTPLPPPQTYPSL